MGPIPREIEGVQFGSIQCFIGPPEFLVGVDDRFEVLSAPGLVADMAHGIAIAGDRKCKRRCSAWAPLRALHGVALFVSQPSSIVSRDSDPSSRRHQGKEAAGACGAICSRKWSGALAPSPIAMTLGDVLPANQQGAIDGAVLALTVDTTMRYYDAAKYITQTGAAVYLLDVVPLQEMVRRPAQGFADDSRYGCGQGRGRGPSVAGRFLSSKRARFGGNTAKSSICRRNEEAER